MFRSLLVLAIVASPLVAQSDPFGHDKVRDYFFTFKQANWWTLLQQTLSSKQDLKADLVVDNVTYKDVGIRVKGASSNLMPGNKKPFNLRMDAFMPGQNLYGSTTLNLNNGAMDPTLTREVTSYWIMRNYLPAGRTGYVRVHLNGTYWGLYILVEQPNKDLLRRSFRDENGTRYKGDQPTSVRINSSTLNWLGSSPALYQPHYEIKNPSHPNAWTDLVRLCDKLNNTPNAQFKTEIVKWLDVDRALWYFACNNLIVNSDDYMGAGHNYYMYFDPTDGRMNMIPWDHNEAYGVHGPTATPETYSVLTGATIVNRPLVRRLLADPHWLETYYAHYRVLLRNWSDWNTQIGPLTKKLQGSIRADVQRDTNWFYTMAQFDPGYARFFSVFHWIPSLRDLVIARRKFLLTNSNLTKPEPQISAVAAPKSIAPGQNVQVTAKVTGSPAIRRVVVRSSVSGAYADNPMYDDGKHGDGQANDGVFGGVFPAGRAGEVMRFYVVGENTSGTLAFSPEGAEYVHYSVQVSFPVPTGAVVVNEVLADNDSGDQDEKGDFDDWVELFNRSPQSYDLSGHWLSDDPSTPRKWQFPANTTIAAGGFLRIWCDNEPTEGKLHATFRIAKHGEVIALYDTDARANKLIDGIAFGQQKGDRSFGRFPDAGTFLYYLWEPSGNRAHFAPGAIVRYDARRTGSPHDLELRGKGTAQVGKTFRWEISGGAANGAAVLLLSALPSQLDIGPLGVLGIEPIGVIPIGVALDAQGSASIPWQVAPFAANIALFQQALWLDLSNALGVWFR